MRAMIIIDRIYNEDCLVGMQRIPDGMVDAIITDLPYEVHRHFIGFETDETYYRKAVERINELRRNPTLF